MNTLRNYLDTMFQDMPNSSKVREAKLELLEMMEDKYTQLREEGLSDNKAISIVISEFGDLDELAEVLGIEKELDKRQVGTNLDLDYVKNFFTVVDESASKISLGVLLIIMSPIVLLIMSAAYELNLYNISEVLANSVGLTVLFIMVATAVGFFIYYGLRLSKFDFLEYEQFNITYDARVFTEQYRDKFNYIKSITIGVIMIILSVVPVVVLSAFYDGTANEEYIVFGVGLLLLIVAIAVYIIVKPSIKYSATKKVLQEGEYKPEDKDFNKKMDYFAGIYWSGTVIIFLLVSFLTNRWDLSWLIWPVASILYGILYLIAKIARDKK